MTHRERLTGQDAMLAGLQKLTEASDEPTGSWDQNTFELTVVKLTSEYMALHSKGEHFVYSPTHLTATLENGCPY